MTYKYIFLLNNLINLYNNYYIIHIQIFLYYIYFKRKYFKDLNPYEINYFNLKILEILLFNLVFNKFIIHLIIYNLFQF